MNTINIEKVLLVSNNTIEIEFRVTGVAEKYFCRNKFYAKYSCEIEDVPYGIAVIPFVCNVLPIAWLTNSQIICKELDADFYESIPNFRKGYEQMYPFLDFQGSISCAKIDYKSELDIIKSKGKSLMFFSGGVDAFATLFAHIDENPTLFILLGSDIKIGNKIGWNNVSKQLSQTAETYKLNALQCESNFREIISESLLTGMVNDLGVVGGWWHEFQHGIGLLGHAAPLVWKYNYTKIYIASTFTQRDYGKVTCASDPTIDNYVQFSGASVCHDQYEYNRQQKIEHIVEYAKSSRTRPILRVCWQGDKGLNCCRCEKCYRTIVGLSVEGEDARKWGFDKSDLSIIEKDLKYYRRVSPWCIPFWQDIQNRIKETPEGTNQVEWLRNYNINHLDRNLWKKMFSFMRRLKRYINRITN